MAPTMFFKFSVYIYFLNYFIKNPQTTIALPFFTHNISAIGGVNIQETTLGQGHSIVPLCKSKASVAFGLCNNKSEQYYLIFGVFLYNIE